MLSGLALLGGAALWTWNRTEVDWTLRQVAAFPPPAVHHLAPVTVAVVDTGIAPGSLWGGHLLGRRTFWPAPQSLTFAAQQAPNPHGTEVAGVVHSVDPLAGLLDVQIFTSHAGTTLSSAIDGLRWAAGLKVRGLPLNRFPARVINASFTLKSVPRTGCAPAMQRAVDEVLRRGSVVVASAGNTNTPAGLNTPAGCRGVIAVAATDARGRRAPYSNWGQAVALAAPGGSSGEGVDVLWTGGGTAERSGTSFAAPLVAGAVSLMLSGRPDLTPAQVRTMLESTARPFAGGQCDADPRRACGAGLLNVTAAVRAALRASH